MIPARRTDCPHGSRCEAFREPNASLLDEVLLAEVGRTLGAARMTELLKLLAAELEDKPRVIREALADRDFHRARHEAHSLKGAAACLGACAVARMAQELEEVFTASAAYRQQVVTCALSRMGGAVEQTRAALAVWPGVAA